MSDYFEDCGGSFHSWLEAQLEYDPPKPAEIHHHRRRESRALCIGCYECRWYDQGCTKPEEQFDQSICDWLSERAREKSE